MMGVGRPSALSEDGAVAAKVQGQSAASALDRQRRDRWRRRLSWGVVGLFSFMAFEGTLVALALQGPWLALLAPGLVCGVKAVEGYRSLRGGGSAAPARD